ncbi:tyrosine-type recombinase/integrase [Amnibacterium sp.]|uniref:tyrosine-type recombinase/integrase n=1 Tax=Amnibacterium sp. TaxID=1872496 RepID=UPI003F7BFD77
MGSIERYETKGGWRYVVRYRKPDNSQGKRRGFARKRDAELYLASVETSKARGDFIDARDSLETVASLGAAWLSNKAQLKPSSLRSLESAWRLHVLPRWGTLPVGRVRHSDVQAWVTKLSTERGPTTVLRCYGVLASILDVAVRDRRILSNPARDVGLPRKVGRAHTYLSREQVESLADAAGEYRTRVLVLADSGLRWGEAIGLRVRHLDLLRRRINVETNAVEVGSQIIEGTPKTHKVRSVPIIASLVEPLARACKGKAPDDLVFAGRAGTFVRRSHNRYGWFASAIRDAGVPRLTVHDLRHTTASLAVQAGANVKAVQRMLGHKSAAMTLDVYADLFDDDLETLAMRLDEHRVAAIVPNPRPRAVPTAGF